ncbi:MAG: extracellular solute-binding protein [Hungatella sp.]|nr:extracellular solute-binding protein [Hungatella sp.]
MRKRITSALLAAVMVTGLMSGCSSNNDTTNTTAGSTTAAAGNTTTAAPDGTQASETAAPGGKKYDGVELTYWSMWTNAEPQGKALEAAAAAFEEETGAKIKFEWKGRDVKNILSSALEAQERFDLFEDDYTRISKNYVDYVADLTAMADAAGYGDKSYTVFNDQAKEWAGFLPCLTEQPTVGGIFYNKDIFTASGITEDPKTWDEFMAACQKMVDAGYQPMALDSTYAPFMFGYHLARNIGESATEELAINGGWSQNEGVVKAAQEMIDFVNAGYLADGAPDEYPASQNKMGLKQDVAMVVCANYVTSEVNANTGVELNWGLLSYPAVANGADDSSTFAGANSIAVTKYSENQQAAFDFAMSIVTGEQDQNKANLANQIPADPANVAPPVQNGTTEVLVQTTAPLSWNMGLNANADKISVISEVVVKLFEGSYATGEDFAAALDALY